MKEKQKMGYGCVICGMITTEPRGSMQFPVCPRCFKKHYCDSDECFRNRVLDRNQDFKWRWWLKSKPKEVKKE